MGCSGVSFGSLAVGSSEPDRVSEGLVSQKFSDAQSAANDALSQAMSAIATLANWSHDFDAGDSSGFDLNAPTVGINANEPSRPTEPSLTYGSVSPPAEPTLDQSMLALLKTKIAAMIAEGGTGLSAATEAAIWGRARGRNTETDARQIQESLTFWSARGFDLPPGPLNAAVLETQHRIARREDDLNNDILIQSSDLAQKNLHFVIEKGISLQELCNEVFKVIFDGRVDLFQATVAYESAKLEAQAKIASVKNEWYDAAMRGYAAELDAMIRGFLGEVELAKAEAELTVKQNENELRAEIAEAELRSEEVQAIAKVAAQLCAAALTSVSASAAIGFRETQSNNVSESHATNDMRSSNCSDIHQYIYSGGD